MKTNKLEFTPEFLEQVAGLYRDMEDAYDRNAKQLDFSCIGCPDNCCDSFFLHHTYTEWAYLWHGLNKLEKKLLKSITEKASDYVVESEAFLARAERPMIMCPLNAEGLCTLYSYRMMICRLHGVPATFRRPDGKQQKFPGCFRCQEITASKKVEPMDRTEFFRRLVNLEIKLLGSRRMTAPRVKLTIAQMIVMGPPAL